MGAGSSSGSFRKWILDVYRLLSLLKQVLWRKYYREYPSNLCDYYRLNRSVFVEEFEKKNILRGSQISQATLFYHV